MLMFAYELSVSLLFIPVTMAVLMKNPKKEAAFGSLAFGLLGFIAFRLYPTPFPKELLALLLSSLGFGIGQYASKLQASKLEA